jgi:hypothetical protein
VPCPQALDDFKQRIRKYDEVYETIDDRTMHYIKLIDMWVEGGPDGRGAGRHWVC